MGFINVSIQCRTVTLSFKNHVQFPSIRLTFNEEFLRSAKEEKKTTGQREIFRFSLSSLRTAADYNHWKNYCKFLNFLLRFWCFLQFPSLCILQRKQVCRKCWSGRVISSSQGMIGPSALLTIELFPQFTPDCCRNLFLPCATNQKKDGFRVWSLCV